MSNPLTFLRPLSYDRTKEILLVQTGPGQEVSGIVARLREIFPSCHIEVLLREADGDLRSAVTADEIRVASYEERRQVLRTLREKSYDAVVFQLGGDVSPELKTLPFLLRTRSIIGFNAHGDYFPLNVFRLNDLARHLARSDEDLAILGLLRRYLLEAIAAPLTVAYLLAAIARLRLRALLRKPGQSTELS